MEGKRSPTRGGGRRRERAAAAAGRLSEAGLRSAERGASWAPEARAPLGAGFHAASQAPWASRPCGQLPPATLHLSLGSIWSGKETLRPRALSRSLLFARPLHRGLESPAGRSAGPGPTFAPTAAWAEALGPRACSRAEVGPSHPPPGGSRVSCRDPEGREGSRVGLTQRPRARPPPSVSSIHLPPASPALVVESPRQWPGGRRGGRGGAGEQGELSSWRSDPHAANRPGVVLSCQSACPCPRSLWVGRRK